MGLPTSRDITIIPGTSLIPGSLLNNLQDSVVGLSNGISSETFGSGKDGDVVLDGTTPAQPWCSKSGSTYTLTADAFPNNLTVIGTGVTLVTANYRLYVKNTLEVTNGAVVHNNGNSGTSSPGTSLPGLATPGGTLNGNAAGATGGTGAGPAGTGFTNSIGGGGGAGGLTLSAGGAGGAVSYPIAAQGTVYSYVPALLGAISSRAGITWLEPGGSGGAGSGGTVPNGGGGGAGGGIVAIAARNILLDNASDIRAFGGNGASQTGSAGGGGGGGGGGIILVYVSLTIGNGSMSGSVCCAGGTGGTTDATGGTPSSGGASGQVFLIDLSVDVELEPEETPAAAGASGFFNVGRAYFNGTDSATVTWAVPFINTNYRVLPGQPVLTSGATIPGVAGDYTSQTQSTMNFIATIAFNGYIDVVAWIDGLIPLLDGVA